MEVDIKVFFNLQGGENLQNWLVSFSTAYSFPLTLKTKSAKIYTDEITPKIPCNIKNRS